jgi:hypothetical protein
MAVYSAGIYACRRITMKVKFLFTIAAIVTFIFGLGFLIAASWTMNLFGITIDTAGVLMTQFLGAAFLGFAV